MALLDNHIFGFNVRRFIPLVLPTALRRKTLLGVLWSLLKPLQSLAAAFYNRRASNTLLARYDSGKGNIERLLNILFDGEERRIYIVNGDDSVAYADTYLFDDGTPYRSDAAYVSSTAEEPTSYLMAEQPQKAFTIVVPAELADSVDAVSEQAAMYVLPGTSFTTVVDN